MIARTYVDFFQIRGIMEGSTGRMMYSMYVCTVGIGVRVYTSERLYRWPSVQFVSPKLDISTIYTQPAKNGDFNMQNDKKLEENPEVCDVLLNKVGKPKDMVMCKAVNVYDDRYRVNIYTRRYVDNIEGLSISGSYFVSYSNNKLNVLYGPKCIT